MSNTKKGWNASKAKKQAGDASKRAIKVSTKERQDREKKLAKGK